MNRGLQGVGQWAIVLKYGIRRGLGIKNSSWRNLLTTCYIKFRVEDTFSFQVLIRLVTSFTDNPWIKFQNFIIDTSFRSWFAGRTVVVSTAASTSCPTANRAATRPWPKQSDSHVQLLQGLNFRFRFPAMLVSSKWIFNVMNGKLCITKIV